MISHMIRAPLFLAIMATSGCASLNVQVAVMDPTYTRAMLARSELGVSGHNRADHFLTATRANLVAFRSRCFDILITENEQKLPQDAGVVGATKSLRDAQSDAGEIARIDTGLIDGLRIKLYKADDVARSAIAATIATNEKGNRVHSSEALQYTLTAWELSYGLAATTVTDALAMNVGCPAASSTSTDGKSQLESATQTAKQAIQAVAIQSVVGNGILLNNRPEAFFVTSAPEQYWAKRYNQAFGRGQFGSASIAIKLNDTADFSVKGFVFDGRSTAEMVKKLGVQAITTVAAAYGAPIGFAKPSSNVGNGSATFDSSAVISTPQTTVLEADAKRAGYRLALFQIADSIMANWDDLTKSDTNAGQNAEQIVDAVANAQAEPYLTDK